VRDRCVLMDASLRSLLLGALNRDMNGYGFVLNVYIHE